MSENDEDKSNQEGEEEVFYDGDCPMCRAFVAKVETKSEASFLDFRKTQLPEAVSREAAEGAIHLVGKDGTITKGAPAVLRLLESNSKLAPFARILQLPPFIWIAVCIYPLFAINRMVLFGPYQRLYWCKIAVVLGFLIPMPITRNLWFSQHSRFYPLIPVHDSLPQIPFPIDYLIFTILILALLLIAALPDPRKQIAIFVALVTSYSLFDQSRLMPYYVEFALMLFAMGFFPWNEQRSPEELREKERVLLNTLGIILIGIWFWSGLHKISAKYLFVGFPWMVEPFVASLSADIKAFVYASAFLSPVVESGGALCLLFTRTRKLGVILLTGMHLAILLVFGPFGLNWNHSVWSWNVVHIVLLWLVFWKVRDLGPRAILLNKGLVHAFLALLFFVAPLLNFFTNWDDFFSHALYSWTTREAEIELKSDRIKQELPKEVQGSIQSLDGREIVHILRWSFSVFESPPYHAERVFKKVFATVCETVEHPDELELILFDKPNWLTGISKRKRLPCAAISDGY